MAEIVWQRASSCGGGGNNCVEVAAETAGIAIRESADPSPVVRAAPAALRALLLGMKAGEFDTPSARAMVIRT